ncbi:MAG: hypothetical protein ACRENP_15405 [Longimicrobiales bacterium]
MIRFLLCSACVILTLAASVVRTTEVQSRREYWAFTGPWDPASHASLRDFGPHLDAVVSGWIALDSTTAQPILPSPFPDTTATRARAPRRMALVTSWHGQRFHPRSIRMLGRDRALLARTAAAIATHAAASGYRGLVLDFEALEPADLDALVRVVSALADSARRRAVTPIVLAIPATDTVAYPARRLLSVADYLLVMLYDQHWAGSEPGPISGPAWVQYALDVRLREVGPDRLLAGLPTYGYRWRSGAATEPIGFRDAQRITTAARVSLQRDRDSHTLRARSDGWDLWVTDAELLRTLVRQIEAQGVHRFALWRLGQEDPAIWRTLVRNE